MSKLLAVLALLMLAGCTTTVRLEDAAEIERRWEAGQ